MAVLNFLRLFSLNCSQGRNQERGLKLLLSQVKVEKKDKKF